MGRALRDNLFVGGLVLMALPSFLFGVLSTLAPLHLAAAGWGAAAIAVVFVVSACVETVISPVAGRVLDRRGVLFPVSVALTAAVPVSVGLAFGPRPLAYVPLIVLAGGAYGALFTPAFALIAEGAERSRLAQGMAFGLMNAAWAMGALIGPVAGGAVAAATGDVVPYLVSAGFCAVALAAVRRAQLRTTARAVPSDVAR
jgi:MFS family permease